MEPSISILLGAVACVLVMPFLAACIYLKKNDLFCNPWLVSFFTRNAGNNPEIRLFESLYASLTLVLKDTRRLLADSLREESLLDEKLSTSDSKLALLEENPSAKTRASDERLRKHRLERRLHQQRQTTQSLRDRVIELEEQAQIAYTKMLVCISREKAERIQSNADARLEWFANDPIELARHRIAAAERKVVSRELRVNESWIERQKQPKQPKPESQLPDAVSLRINDAIARLNSIRDFFGRISDLLESADPHVGRAYGRLQKYLQMSRKLCSISADQENALEHVLAKNELLAAEWQQRADLAREQNDETLEQHAVRRKSQYYAGSEELRAALKAQRKRNLLIGNLLFQIEILVRRAYLVALLLEALPQSMKQSLMEYKQLVALLGRQIRTLLNSPDLEPVVVPDDFDKRISRLEHASVMAYITIAKKQSAGLSRSAARSFRKRVGTTWAAVLSTRDLQKADFDRWDRVFNEGAEAGQEFLCIVASQRRDECARVLRTAQQGAEVLAIIISLLDRQLGDDRGATTA